MDNIVSIFDLQKDGIGKSIVFIDYDHAQVHEGETYKFFTYKTALGAGASYSIYFTTNTLKNMHLKNLELWSSGAEAWADIYEALTATTTGGKSIVAYNCNRKGTSTSGITIKGSATVMTLGGAKQLDRIIVGGSSTNQSKLGGNFQPFNEWILAKNTKYGVKITNKGAGTNNVYFSARFYNETTDLG